MTVLQAWEIYKMFANTLYSETVAFFRWWDMLDTTYIFCKFWCRWWLCKIENRSIDHKAWWSKPRSLDPCADTHDGNTDSRHKQVMGGHCHSVMSRMWNFFSCRCVPKFTKRTWDDCKCNPKLRNFSEAPWPDRFGWVRICSICPYINKI